MKEFMLIIRNTGDKMESMSPEKQKVFLEKVKAYIGKLEVKGILKGAQPLERQGKIISGTKGAFKTESFSETKDVIVGYYHILANDLEEAIYIAKENPEFEYTTTARIEVRPIKMKEELIDFVYH